MRVLQRYVQVGHDATLGHQRNDGIDMRIRIDVVQAHPGAVRCGQFAQGFDELGHVGLDRTAVPETGAELDIDAIGAGVLRNHQQFAHAGLEQVFGFQHDVGDRPRHQVTAHRRDDAETATVVAAFGNLQVSIVPRRQLDALRRHQVDERRMRLRQMQVDRIHDFGQGMGAGHGEYFRMDFLDDVVAVGILLRAQAAGDDHLAVFMQRFTDGVERLLHRGVDEAAGIDDHQVGAVIRFCGVVAFGAQLGQDLFGIDQRLRTTEGDKTDFGRNQQGRGHGGRQMEDGKSPPL